MPLKQGEAQPTKGRHQINGQELWTEDDGTYLYVFTAGHTHKFKADDTSKATGPTGGKVPADQPSPFQPAPDAGEGEQGGNS